MATATRRLVRSLQVPLRASTGAGLAIAISTALSMPYPVFAAITAILVTDLRPETTLKAGGRRLLATVIGAGLGALFARSMPEGPVPIGIGVIAAMLASQVARAPDGAKLAGLTCAIVMLLDRGADPWVFAFHRLLETGLGVIIAWAISLIPKLLPPDHSP